MSVTFMHPAKAVGWNEMPLGRDTHEVLSNTVSDRGKGRFGGQNPQFPAMPPIATLLWPMLSLLQINFALTVSASFGLVQVIDGECSKIINGQQDSCSWQNAVCTKNVGHMRAAAFLSW